MMPARFTPASFIRTMAKTTITTAITTSARMRGMARRFSTPWNPNIRMTRDEADRDQEQQRLARDQRDGRIVRYAAIAREQHEPDKAHAHRDRHVEHVLAQLGAQPDRGQRKREPCSDEELGVGNEVGSGHRDARGRGGAPPII